MGLQLGLSAGGGGTALPTAKNVIVSAISTGPLCVAARLLASTSTFSLISGSNANLAINSSTGAISATSAIGVGSSQLAMVREAVSGQNLSVEYPLTLVADTSVSSRRFATFGDSRTEHNTLDFPNTNRTVTAGYAGFIMSATEGRAIYAPGGNYGHSGWTTGSPGPTGYRLNDVIDAAIADMVSKNVKTVVYLAGVNDTSSNGFTSASQSIANYTTALDKFLAAGLVVILCNELPRNSLTGLDLTMQLARRDWLADPARKVTWPNIVQVDTFSPCFNSATQSDWKAGLASDGLHPDGPGNQIIGGVIGAAMKQILTTSGLAPIMTLPGLTSQPYNASTNPNGYLLANFLLTGNGGAIGWGSATGTGTMPDNWSLNAGSAGAVNITLSRPTIVNSLGETMNELQIRVQGTPGAGTGSLIMYLDNIANAAYAAGVSVGDAVAVGARLRLLAGSTGFTGFGLGVSTQGQSQNYMQFGQAAYAALTPPIDEVLMSQEIILDSTYNTGTKRITAYLPISYKTGVPVDFTIGISQIATAKVPSDAPVGPTYLSIPTVISGTSTQTGDATAGYTYTANSPADGTFGNAAQRETTMTIPAGQDGWFDLEMSSSVSATSAALCLRDGSNAPEGGYWVSGFNWLRTSGGTTGSSSVTPGVGVKMRVARVSGVCKFYVYESGVPVYQFDLTGVSGTAALKAFVIIYELNGSVTKLTGSSNVA